MSVKDGSTFEWIFIFEPFSKSRREFVSKLSSPGCDKTENTTLVTTDKLFIAG